MIERGASKLLRMAVFYDGNYFFHVSNYYNYEHNKKSRIHIGGLHQLIRGMVSEKEGIAVERCRIVDSHYFRGRLNAYEARENQKLFSDRMFDDILMNEGVTPHYLPVKTRAGKREEKGIDVWLALEAYESVVLKNIDVLVMIACDGDYLPLIRKVNAFGTRVMLLGWDFKYADENGKVRETRTSTELIAECTYPLLMTELVDELLEKQDERAENLFVSQEGAENLKEGLEQPIFLGEDEDGQARYAGTIIGLKDGYGFILSPPNNIFFHNSETSEQVFKTLVIGDTVTYSLTRQKNGKELAVAVKKLSEQEVGEIS